ncbi:MAG: retron St85 family effector protein, partial [Deltaproteobacteria bacterium]|nr:retron St85 family effector protein [Deltaproteobacteria bacterium]
MEIHDIFKEWTSSIDLGKTQVVRFPSLIFLCGGPISEIPENFESCRDIFYKYINKSHYPFREKVLLVEKVFSYFKHSAYRDLLRFETDLAELSALTVIFSESPGSIAELGALAVLKPVREKLLVVIHEDDGDKESFIWRGPVLFLKGLAEA